MKNKHLNRHIFLIGFMGTGKSTIGEILSDRFKFPFFDTDILITERTGLSISDIFDRYGEDYFRETETEVLKECSDSEQFSVISCGGGIVLREENRKNLKSTGTVVLLTAKAGDILERIQNDGTRPLLNNKKSISHISEMLLSREPLYRDVCDFVIETDGKSPAQICDEIEYLLDTLF